MSALIRLLAGAAFTWLAPTGPAGVAGAPVPTPATADCMIRFEVANGLQDHRIQVELTVFRPSNADAIWERAIGTARWLQPGEERAWYQTLPGRCGARRQYHFQLRAFAADGPDDERGWLFHLVPSGDGWSTRTELRLGDLGRFFADLESDTPGEPPTTEPGNPAPAPTPAPETQPATPTGNPAPPPGDPGGGTTEGPGGVPAGTALLTEDFTAVPEGGFPEYFEHLGGNAQVGSVDGRPALVMGHQTWFRVPLGGDLGERFTIEFDYRSPSRFAYFYVAPFHAATATGAAGLHYRHIPFHHFAITTESIGAGVRGGMPDMPHAVSLNAAYTHGLVPIRLVVEGEAAAVFVDGEQVARLPRADIPRTDVLEFFYHGNRGPGHIANLRVTSE